MELLAFGLEEEAGADVDLNADICGAVLCALCDGHDDSFGDVLADLDGEGVGRFVVAAGSGDEAEAVDSEGFPGGLENVGALAGEGGDGGGELEGLESVEIGDVFAEEEIGKDAVERKGRGGAEGELGAVQGTAEAGGDGDPFF